MAQIYTNYIFQIKEDVVTLVIGLLGQHVLQSVTEAIKHGTEPAPTRLTTERDVWQPLQKLGTVIFSSVQVKRF